MAAVGCSAADGDVSTISVGDVDLRVWVADEPEERQRGLMGVESLPAGVDGMLFLFEEAAPRWFHMGNTLIPLDIWWFDADGLLVGMDTMEPCEAAPCQSYHSPVPVVAALETLAGEWALPAGAVLSNG
jgi:uncharacterized protein